MGVKKGDKKGGGGDLKVKLRVGDGGGGMGWDN